MKTKPHTIRFEEGDFKFICKRENLQTAQAILNFLMGEYLKLYKVEKKSIYDNTIGDIINPKGFTDRVALNQMPIEKRYEILRDWVEACNASKKLTDWERSFIDSVGDYLHHRGTLSEKQTEILERIYTEKT